MRFVSTRGGPPAANLSEALRNGAAPNGGLYMPEELPSVDLAAFDHEAPLADFAAAEPAFHATKAPEA